MKKSQIKKNHKKSTNGFKEVRFVLLRLEWLDLLYIGLGILRRSGIHPWCGLIIPEKNEVFRIEFIIMSFEAGVSECK